MSYRTSLAVAVVSMLILAAGGICKPVRLIACKWSFPP